MVSHSLFFADMPLCMYTQWGNKLVLIFSLSQKCALLLFGYCACAKRLEQFPSTLQDVEFMVFKEFFLIVMVQLPQSVTRLIHYNKSNEIFCEIY